MNLRPHQIQCVNNIKTHFENENRALIKMFCGAGKSFVIYHCLLEFGNNLSVVVVPSINLITQFNRDYLLNDKMKVYNKNNFKKFFELITICSKNELSDNKTDFVFTTEDDNITEFLEQDNNKIVLITYQSLEKLIKITKLNDIKIDLLCFDEAHHILGMKMKDLLFGKDEDDVSNDESNDDNNSEYQDSIFDSGCFIDDFVNKTLFFTATPQNRNGIMMYESVTFTSINDIEYEIIDDEDTVFSEEPHCGKMIYEYMHINGVNDDILNDFKIRVDLYTENTDKNVFEAICRSIFETNNSRVLTFHSNSNETEKKKNSNVIGFSSKENYKHFLSAYETVLNNEFPDKKNKFKNITFVGITADKIFKNGVEYKPKDGNKMPLRQRVLEEFDTASDDEIYVLASCKTIGEGVDTKKANMICFVDPKQSYIEIVQNIGRVCRKNDRLATVLLPAYVDVEKYKDCKGDVEKIDSVIRKEMSKTGNFNGILNVLSALRQEDPYTFELCLKYPETYTKKEMADTLKKKCLILDKEYAIDQIFKNNNLKYEKKLSEKENFENLAEKLNTNIQVLNQKILDEDIIIDKDCDKTTYFVKTEEGKIMKVKGEHNEKVERPNRNIKPVVHTNDEIKVLWGMDGDIGCKSGVFGGFIKASVIESGDDVWMKKLEEVVKYIDENGKKPSCTDRNSNVKKNGLWICQQQQNYMKKNGIMKKSKIQKHWEKFIKQYKNIFELRKEIWKSILKNIEKYIDENKKKISYTSKMGRWILIQNKIYEKKIMIMKNWDIRNLWEEFKTKHRNYFSLDDEIWSIMLILAIQYMEKTYERLDKNMGMGINTNMNMNKIERWIFSQQINYKNGTNIMKRPEIRQQWKEFIKKYEDYFLSGEELWTKMLKNAIEYINKNNKKPSIKDKNLYTKKIFNWINIQCKDYELFQEIMNRYKIREQWENFITEYQQYFPNNPAIQEKKPTKKSTTIKPKTEQKESDEQKRTHILSEYQELTKKMSTQKSSNTKKMFENENLWHQYHDCRDFSFQGYDNQNEIPVNKIISYLETKKNHKLKILDLGCGRNLIYEHFKDNKKFTITGYDYVSCNDSKVADISDLPEEDESVKICVFSQSLMGSNWNTYMDEGYRVLEYNGEMIISENQERYDIVKAYLQKINMHVIKEDYNETNRWFYIYAIKQ